MIDTMTTTKVVAAICGAWLILLLGYWAADEIYHVDDHGEQAFAIEVEGGGDEEEADEAIDFATLFAAADAGAGERIWRQCQACHKLEDGANGTGPYLYGVVGRDIGSASGYAYSEALASHGGVWSPENLDGFLTSPKDWAPGTKMSYNGLKGAEDRAHLIAYLNTFGGNADPASYAGQASDEAPAEEAPAEEATDEAAPEAPAADQAVEEEAAAEEAPAADTATEEAQAEDAATDAAATEETATDEAAAEEAATEETATEEAATEAAPAADTATEETATEEAASDEAPAAEEAATEETATEETAAADTAPAAEMSGFAALVAAADPAEGEGLFRACAACHKLEEGGRGSGPYLYGVVGRDIASVDGFRYSDALIELEGNWTVEKLGDFLENPRSYARGTKMSYPGMRDENDRAALIAYLSTIGN